MADFDVVVVGAGISGLNAAYRIQTRAPPSTRFVVLEARDAVGGTWDLFRYPGVRSDSDMYTFSFAWCPWLGRETLAAGSDIRAYLERCAADAGLDRHVRRRHRVVAADWVSRLARWELSVDTGDGAAPVVFGARFLFLATGYYDYDRPRDARIPGLASFRGPVLHPQFWPAGADCAGQHVVVVGSGATAVTLVPALAASARHVTMLQRSPSYIFPVAGHSPVAAVLTAVLPGRRLAAAVARLLFIVQGYLMVVFCSAFPAAARRLIRLRTTPLLPPGLPCDPHFTPRYDPWQQRVCAARDGDFFAALRSGKASVVTDTIDAVTPTAIRLASGAVLHPDVVVTATGLRLHFAGGIRLSTDGEPARTARRFAWRAAMLDGLPNLFFSVGYENASWTLGADCAAHLLTRLMCELRRRGATVAVPRVDDAAMEAAPLFSLTSTYIKEQLDGLPQAGAGVWAPRTHYAADMCAARWGSIETGLVLR